MSKLLARKSPGDSPPALSPGYRYSLGTGSVAEYNALLAAAFDRPGLKWVVPDGLIGTPLIRHNGVLVAAACVIRPCFLNQVAVLPRHQGQGLGGYLVHTTARLFELPYIIVQVDDTTTDHGLAFWRAQGFKELGT